MCPQWHPGSCKVCGGTPAEVGDISGTGLCRTHAEERRKANLLQLAEKSGPYYDRWRRRSFMVAYARLLDDQRSAP